MRVTLVVFCLAVLAATVTAGPAPPPNPEIVFVESGTTTKIRVMNSDGSNKTTIYSAAAFLSEPDLSPDAGWVAFARTGTGLIRVDRITKVATVLMTEAACGGKCGSPRFSPSGSRIAVINEGQDPPQVWAVPTTGGTPVLLYAGTPGNPFFEVAWDTDESQIALREAVAGGGDRIIVVNLATGTARTIVNQTGMRHLDWARNGVDQVLFDVVLSPDSLDANLYTVDFSDTSADPPVLLVTGGTMPSYSPDNGSIVYRQDKQPFKMLKRVLSTGATTNLGGGNMPQWKR